MLKVAKFGGSSLSDAARFENFKRIVLADGDRKIVVVSAPGKRYPADTKVTDLLIKACFCAKNGGNYVAPLKEVESRYAEIAEKLSLSFDVKKEFAYLYDELPSLAEAFVLSRGEYLCARMAAEYLGFDFIDAAEIILFDYSGKLNYGASASAAAKKISGAAVIPGFYGGYPNGQVKIFARGGGDESGAILASLMRADLYENWTDVSGVKKADPAVIPYAETIREITFSDLRLLSVSGARVLQENAVSPAKKAGIPINVRNSASPSDEGTTIVSDYKNGGNEFLGVTISAGFYSVRITLKESANRSRALAEYASLFEGLNVSVARAELCGDELFFVVSGDLGAVPDEVYSLRETAGATLSEGQTLVTVLGVTGIAAGKFLTAAQDKIPVEFCWLDCKRRLFYILVNSVFAEEAARAAYNAAK